MRRRILLFLPICAALLLGWAWPSAGGVGGPDITLTMQDPGGAVTGAREPAILLPGPRLRWSTEEGVAGRVLQDGVWMTEDPQEATSLWKSGVLEEEGAAPGITSFSAASLRNGVRRDMQGGIVGWSPDVGVDAAGGSHMVEDQFRNGSFDVLYRGPNGQIEAVASSLAFEAHASVAVDAAARAWIAWDEGSTAWGRGDGLRTQRSLRLVRRGEEGWREVPLPALATLVGKEASAGGFQASAELPRLVAEQDGPLWMFYRVMIPFTDPESRTASRKVAWIIRATCLSETGWSAPITLPASDGPNHDTLAVVDLPDGGVLAAWTTDQRLARFGELKLWSESVMDESRLQVAELQCAGDLPAGTLSDATPWKVSIVEGPPAPGAESESDSPAVDSPAPAVGLQRMWGDLHRHSDLSRCSMHTDGSVPDQYRYSASTGALDFVAITDHHQHIRPDAWSFLLDCTDRFQEPLGLQPMFGFEAAFPDGHRNLISDRRDAVAQLPFHAVLDRGMRGLDAETLVVIPHQMAARNAVLDWSGRFPALETQLEIYQRRGSYESSTARRTARNTQPDALYMTDHLLAGERFGILASSDHQFSAGAFAVVYAEDRSRSAILEALHARRSYAATARIELELDLGGMKMGAEGAVEAAAPLQVTVDAGADIARVEVVRNGEVAHTWDGSSPSADGVDPDSSADGLLLFRYGKLSGAPDLPLHGEGIEFGTAVLFDGEAGKASTASGATPWSPGIFLHYASRRAQALGGWAIPVRFTEKTGTSHDGEPTGSPAVAPTRTISLGDGRARTTWTEAELRTGSEWLRKHKNRPVSIRLEGPPLGRERLHAGWAPGDWKEGDWVYVRVVRVDGAMAWSSPIWVEQVR